MTEQQPVEATQATPAPEQKSSEAAPTRTADEVEVEYKARLSGKDRAHAAEVATLRASIEALSGEKSQVVSQAGEASTEVEALRTELAQARKANVEQTEVYNKAIRAEKYPNAAEALDPHTLATMDEAKLAGLNERLTPPAPPRPVDPSTPPRTTTAPKPTEEKSVEELKADLKAMGPQFASELNR